MDDAPQAANLTPDRATPQGGARGFDRAEATYVWCAGMFMVLLVLTNVIGTKLFTLDLGGLGRMVGIDRPITLTSGIITYPLTFLLTDVVSEIWGRRRASFMVWAGFAASLVMLAIVQLAVVLPPDAIWVQEGFGFDTAEDMQRAFHATFAAPGKLLFASMSAYLIAQLLDVRMYHLWWRLTKGRHMWLRNNGSTWVSQLVDTITVNAIFLRWHFQMDWSVIWAIIWANYFVKMLLAALDTPLIYLMRGVIERFLGIPTDPDRRHAPLA